MASAPVTVQEWRERMLPHFTAALEELQRHFHSEVARVATALRLDAGLFLGSARIKEAASAAITARRRKMDYWKLPDWVGMRVSCPTPEAAYHLSLTMNSFPQWRAGKRFDYNLNPKLSGYRGIHVYGEVQRDGAVVPCEFQVHTRLQTLWSELTHDEVYKADGSTSHLVQDTATNLAAYMAATDQLIGRMLNILRDPEAQLKAIDTAPMHYWIATLASVHAALPPAEVDATIRAVQDHGLRTDQQLQWFLERWEPPQFDRLRKAVMTNWQAAGCRPPSVLDIVRVATRLVAERVFERAEERTLAAWAAEQADLERQESAMPNLELEE